VPGQESTSLSHNPPVPGPELLNPHSYLHVTPVINFYDDKDHNDPILLSNSSSDIEDESELHRFTQTLQEAQIAALKGTKNKQGVYLKRSKQTQQHCMQVHVELSIKGFLPVDEFMRQKGIPTKQNVLTPHKDANAHSSADGAFKVEPEEKSQDNSDGDGSDGNSGNDGDNSNDRVGDCTRQHMSEDKKNEKETHSMHERFKDL